MTDPKKPNVQSIEASRLPDRVGANTLDKKVHPIVLLPGVMGSRLQLASNAKWDPDDLLGMVSGWASRPAQDARVLLSAKSYAKVMTTFDVGNFGVLTKKAWAGKLSPLASTDDWKAIDLTRSRYGIVASNADLFGTQLGWAGVSLDSYLPMLMGLHDTFNGAGVVNPAYWSHPIHAIGYDWRVDMSDMGSRVAAQIAQIRAKYNEKVILVTHSMGGLVARAACKQGAESDVKGVVHVVQPVNGAVVCYRRFVDGVGADWPWYHLPKYIFAQVIGGSRWGFTTIMSGMIGPVQLMPNQFYESWLTDKDGKSVPASKVFDVYLNQGPMCVVPALTDKMRQDMEAERLADVTDAMKEEALETDTQVSNPRVSPSAQAQAKAKLKAERDKVLDNLWPGYMADLTASVHASKTFYDGLGEYVHPRSFLLYAGGKKTDAAYDWSKKEGKRAQILDAHGDGTVPAASALGIQLPIFKAWSGVKQPFGLELPLWHDIGDQGHQECFGDAGVVDSVLDRVKLLRYV